jgi:hypothetical protein
VSVRVRALTASLVLIVPVVLAGSQSWKNSAPESFRANGQILATPGGVAASMTIQIDRYTTDADHQALVAALNGGDNAAFLAALRNAPVVGALKIGDRTIALRWARERPQGEGRRIAAMTDAPVYFLGAGAADAKPTAGFDVAVLEFTLDSIGLGNGTMAAAARVKPGGPSGIQIDDYAGKRITLVTVTRNSS